MNATEILAEFDTLTRNTNVDSLWAPAEKLLLLNWAEQEACRRADLLWDDSTEEVAVYALNEVSGWTPLSSLVLKIESARFGATPLKYVPKATLDVLYPGWQTVPAGTPRFITLNANRLALFPSNAAAGDLVLTVSRLPAAAVVLEPEPSSPEISADLHLALTDGMLHRAYLKNDSETYNKGASDYHLAAFEKTFGPPVLAGPVVWVEAGSRRRRVFKPAAATTQPAAPAEGGGLG